MEKNLLINLYPYLYHMAEKDSWPNIRENGLLSTSSLLDLYEITGEERELIEARRRSESVTIYHPGFPDAVVRDQKPMTDGALARALSHTSLTPSDWYRILNNKTFFWTSKNRLHRLLNARPYANLEHDVLTIDTKILLEKHEQDIRLCPINSGNTKPFPWPRDESYFSTIEDYDWNYWRKGKNRPKWDAVVEVCVEGGIRDIEGLIVSVDRMRGEQVLRNIYKG